MAEVEYGPAPEQDLLSPSVATLNWIAAIERGGLFCINENTFHCMEMLVRETFCADNLSNIDDHTKDNINEV